MTNGNTSQDFEMNLQLFADGADDEGVVEELTPEQFNEELESQQDKPDEEDVTPTDDQPGKTDEEEFDEIVYNKQPVKIPKSERTTYLQKGYNYDKVQGKLVETESQLKELEQLTGLSISDIKEKLKEQTIIGEAQKLLDADPTMSEETAIRLAKLEQKDREREIAEKRRETESRNTKQKLELKDKPFFNELEQEIDALVSSAPDVDVKTAYTYLRGEKLEELMEKAKDTTKKSTIADIQDRSKRGITGGDGTGEPTITISPEAEIMAREMGVNPLNVAKRLAQRTKN